MTYLVGAILLGTGFLWCAIQFSRQLMLSCAKQLFFASIIYLALLLALLVWDKLKLIMETTVKQFPPFRKAASLDGHGGHGHYEDIGFLRQ